MKRPLLATALLCLAGVLVTVAVAWALAALPKQWFGGDPSFSNDAVQVIPFTSPGAARYLLGVSKQVTAVDVQDVPSLPPWSEFTGKPGQSIMADAFGWPCLALACNFDLAFVEPAIDLFATGVTHGIALDSVYSDRVPIQPSGAVSIRGEFFYASALPLRPIWPGFALNSLLYAASLTLLVLAAVSLRKLLRRARSLCPACGYPFGSSAICTECGASLSKRAVA